VRRLAGIFIEHFGITQLYDIRPWPACGFSSRLCRGAAGVTASSSPVDIEALAARYQNEDFWRAAP